MTKDTLKVKWLHAPGHAGSVGPNVVEYAASHKPLAIDFSEMYWNTDDLKVIDDEYDSYIGKPKGKDSRGRVPNHDVIISTLKEAEILHEEEFFVSGSVKSLIKYMPQRWGKARVIEFEGQIVLFIAWHPHPNPLRRIFLVKPKYKAGVHRVEQVQTRLEREYKPDLVLNGGDLQLPPGKDWIAPNQFAERHGMKYRWRKIDWQLFKGKGWSAISHKPIDPSKINNGMDHGWDLLTLEKTVE